MKRLAAALLLLYALPAAAAEEILSFHSDITVRGDSSMLVTETIKVRAENRQIKRGIYRDFPTDYRTKTGTRIRVDFEVVAIERDGRREAWHTQRLSNGVRVYVGRKDVILKPGVYTYRITYMTDRQLGYFKDHDELYWNVTGNGWGFPIHEAGAQVRLPPGIPRDAVRVLGFTGKHGEEGDAFVADVTAEGARFRTTRPLGKREGLTIVAMWPKGHVFEPTWEDRLRYRWRDDPAVFILWTGAVGLFLYYLLAWFVVGRDPRPGVVVPEYEAPKGYPPAALRMVRRMGWDDKALSSALVGLAVKGALTIKEDDEQYSVMRTDKVPDTLAPGEKAVLDAIGFGRLEFKSSNHERVKKLREAHREALEKQYEKHYFYSNKGWLVFGWLLTAAVVGYAVLGFFGSFGPQFVPVLIFGSFIVAFAVPFLKVAWIMRERHARVKGNWVRLASAAFSLAVVGFMFGFGLLRELGTLVSLPMMLGIMAIATINVVFNELVKAPTLRGRKLLDHIEGFRDYLGIAESDELRFKYAREVTPDRFEEFLPYAIALDVETQWSERFASALRARGQDPSAYRASWYDGHSFSGVRGMSSSVGSAMAATVSSASNPPGSSSGGGGGGFSGGGGGGGGGGGW